jgi:hypothetical protein
LQEVVVVRGQAVKRADHRPGRQYGNSAGAHLHFSLKKKNATANRETTTPRLIDPTRSWTHLNPTSTDAATPAQLYAGAGQQPEVAR